MLCDRPYVSTFAGFNTVLSFFLCFNFFAALTTSFLAASKFPCHSWVRYSFHVGYHFCLKDLILSL